MSPYEATFITIASILGVFLFLAAIVTFYAYICGKLQENEARARAEATAKWQPSMPYGSKTPKVFTNNPKQLFIQNCESKILRDLPWNRSSTTSS